MPYSLSYRVSDTHRRPNIQVLHSQQQLPRGFSRLGRLSLPGQKIRLRRLSGSTLLVNEPAPSSTSGRSIGSSFGARHILILIFLLAIPLSTWAAEVRGRIWDETTREAPQGGTIRIVCGSQEFPGTLAPNGSYSIRGVPSGGTCQFFVNAYGLEASRTIAVNGPVVNFSGEVRRVGGTIVLIPR